MFELPKLWSVKIDDENREVLNQWRKDENKFPGPCT